MSCDNQDLTIHLAEHSVTNPNCEHCAVMIKNSFSPWLMKFKEEMRELKYRNELRKCWLVMIEKYPQHYSLDDYFEACGRTGITVF